MRDKNEPAVFILALGSGSVSSTRWDTIPVHKFRNRDSRMVLDPRQEPLDQLLNISLLCLACLVLVMPTQFNHVKDVGGREGCIRVGVPFVHTARVVHDRFQAHYGQRIEISRR